MNNQKTTGRGNTGRQGLDPGSSTHPTKPAKRTSIFYTLRVRLLAGFLVIALVPLGILTYINSRTTEQALTDAANQALISAARQTGTMIDDFIQIQLSAISDRAELSTFASYLSIPAEQRSGSIQEVQVRSQLNTSYEEDVAYSTFAAGYFLFDRDGRIAMKAGRQLGEPSTVFAGVNLADPDNFTRMMGEGQAFVSPVIFEPTGSRPVIFFSARVLNDEQQTLGVLAAVYDAAILQSYLERNIYLAGDNSYPILFDELGIALGNAKTPSSIYKTVNPYQSSRIQEMIDKLRLPNKPIASLTVDLPRMAEGLQQAGSISPHFETFTETEGRELSSAAVYSLKNAPWKVTYLVPQSVFLAPVSQQTRAGLLLGGLMTIAVAAAALMISRRMTTPITRLTEAAERISAGDLSAQAPAGADEIGQLAGAFNTMTGELRRTLEGLEVRVAERTAALAKASDKEKSRANQLQTVAEVAHTIAAMQELDPLLRTVTELIAQRFSFYHVGIFLIDSTGEWAVLRAANSEGGQRMLERNHRLRVGQVGIVGYATGRGEPRIALDVGADAVYFDNPDLPYTRSEMALPLKVGVRVIGALDVQSMEQSAFSEEDVNLLSTLADQVAVAIENVRLFSETRNALAELQTLQKQYLKKEWQQEVIESGRSGYEYISGRLAPVTGQEIEINWIDIDDLEASAEAETGLTEDNTSLKVPIKVRGYTIGMLDLGSPEGQWRQDEINMIQAVADQVGLALENARLLEQTQRRAEREHMVSEITSRLRSSNDPQVILQTAAQELRKALRARQSRVIIPTPFAASSPDESKSSEAAGGNGGDHPGSSGEQDLTGN